MKRWLAMEIGCLECSDSSKVIGVYDAEADAIEAAGGDVGDNKGYYQVFDLATGENWSETA